MRPRKLALFVHIPKTAGVSVCRSVFETEQLFGHAPASGWRKRDRSRFDTLFTFSLMREPKDRFFAAFYYLRNSALTQKDHDFSARHLAVFDTRADLLAAMARSPLLRTQIEALCTPDLAVWNVAFGPQAAA